MIIAINYADVTYKNAQKLNSKTALLHDVDFVIEYGPEDIDREFYEKNREILDQKRGNGYWLWKPYFIMKTIEQMEEEDYLIYSDSGAFYINSIKLLIKCMHDANEDIMVFTLPNHMKEKIWSKRDAFILMDCDSKEYTDSPQRLAGFILIKKTKYTYEFVLRWLNYSQDPRIITDQENCMGKSNYFGFRENRHDQTILSLLSKKYKLKGFPDPSCIITDEDARERSYYPQIFDLHRMSDVLEVEEVSKRRWKEVNKVLDCWKSGKKIVLYGAGKNARKFIMFLLRRGLKVEACVISDNQTLNCNDIEGIKIYHLSHLPYSQQDIIVLVTINIFEIQENLMKSGFIYQTLNGEVLNVIDSEMEKLYVENT